jgi:ribose transport system ATP-binding protein
MRPIAEITAENDGDGPLLRLAGVSKTFPGVQALDRVDFDLRVGETHVLFGENGAGKSTLISIVAGAQRATTGTISLRGMATEFTSVHDARLKGIATVFQEFSLIPSLTVEENIFLGSEPTRGGLLDQRAMRREAIATIERLGFSLSPQAVVARLTRAEQQMVEIARAFRIGMSLLILDEPTASLTDRETDQLFKLVAQLKAHGVGIIYITHRIREIMRIGDRVTVLRDGKKIATLDPPFSESDLVMRMMGRPITQLYPNIRSQVGEPVLEIKNVSSAEERLNDVSLTVNSGEIVGLAGLVGSGKSEVVRAAFGLSSIDRGEVRLEGTDVTGQSPSRMLKAGFMYLPPDRRVEGLMMARSCRENMMLAAFKEADYSRPGWMNLRRERQSAAALAQQVGLQPLLPDNPVQTFSGGNQQKVMLARSLTRKVRLYAFDEPTVGVDVGTRAAIYKFIASLCEAGAGIILISSDLPEILHLAHRAYVFYAGEIKAEIPKLELTEENLLPHFFERTHP